MIAVDRLAQVAAFRASDLNLSRQCAVSRKWLNLVAHRSDRPSDWSKGVVKSVHELTKSPQNASDASPEISKHFG